VRRLIAWILGRTSGAWVSKEKSKKVNEESVELRREAAEVIKNHRLTKEFKLAEQQMRRREESHVRR